MVDFLLGLLWEWKAAPLPCFHGTSEMTLSAPVGDFTERSHMLEGIFITLSSDMSSPWLYVNQLVSLQAHA